MSDSRWHRISRIYNEAIAVASRDRDRFVREACGSDDTLRAEVSALLVDDSRMDRFLGPEESQLNLMGRRIGIYEVTSLLGVGGMGEVYQARDPKLNRDVAIKVLPRLFINDPNRLARFEREARVLASLNHPHIGAIYGLEDADGVRALVLELVHGETLADRILRGPIPLHETFAIARQIADAVEAAHEKGIVHRDLKPANIKLTPDGIVKVLDFGLAKAASGDAPGDGTQSPTMTTGATTEGVILGTATYMSPEQARGRAADKRADVWAFGVVWFEMLTGRRAFEGEATSDVLAKVIEREPDWAALPSSTPPRVRELLHRCLRKDPKTRLQAIGDARVQLDEWFSGATEDTPAAGATGPRIHRGVRVAWIAAALSLAIVAALAISAALYFRRLTPERAVTRFEISTPPTGDPVSFALSADGRQLAFVADSEGAPRLWVRTLDQVTAQPLPGTEGASYPFWSPDGRAIGFFADGKLKKVDLGSAGSQELASAPSGRGGAWNRDDVLVFAADVNRGVITRVAAAGGTPVAVTKHIPGLGSHRWPQFLPDGRHFIFFAGYGPPDKQGVFVGTVDGGEPAHVLSTETAAVYSPPGVLLWVHQGVIIAQRFDPERKVVSGEPIPVAHAVGVDDGVLRGAFAVSANGVLAHRVARGERRQLTWVDRAGVAQGTVGPPDEDGLSSPELAPNGRRVLVQRSVQGNPDVWMMETGRNVPSRQFTFDASNEGLPLWSSDGGRVVFAALRHGAFNLFEKAASGAGNEQPRLLTGAHKTPLGWSPDGRFLLYATQHLKTGSDLWALALTGDRKPLLVVQTPFDDTAGQLSPDGRWVAYQSSDRPVQIYIQPFLKAGDPWQVSTAGGSQPRWRPDGKELFYIAADARLMAVPVAAGVDTPDLQVGTAVALFRTRLASGSNIPSGVLSKPQYAVAANGRFLMNVVVEGAAAPPITVVLNWDAALTK